MFNVADSARISLLRFHGSSDYINACFIDVSVLNVSMGTVIIVCNIRVITNARHF